MPNKSIRQYNDGTHRFDYTVHLKPRLKHRYIRIRNGEVIVTAALRTSDKTIETFVTTKADWIIKHLDASNKTASYDLSRPGTQLYWRGRLHDIEIKQSMRDQLHIADGVASFTVKGSPDHSTLLTLLHRHHKQHAPSILLPRVEHWSNIMGLRPARVSFRRARTRWGSCSSHNSLSFNIHMMMLPDLLIDDIIVHELAHIQEKNHGQKFWDLVAHHIPEWKTNRKALRTYEPYLS